MLLLNLLLFFLERKGQKYDENSDRDDSELNAGLSIESEHVRLPIARSKHNPCHRCLVTVLYKNLDHFSIPVVIFSLSFFFISTFGSG